MLYYITFPAAGGLLVEADSVDEAWRKFESEMQEGARRELAINGIDITGIWETRHG